MNERSKIIISTTLIASLLAVLCLAPIDPCDANPLQPPPQPAPGASLAKLQKQQQAGARSLSLQQANNGSSSNNAGAASEVPAYVTTGKKISKILNDFFDVSV